MAVASAGAQQQAAALNRARGQPLHCSCCWCSRTAGGCLCAAALAAVMACHASGCSLHSSCRQTPMTPACTPTVGAWVGAAGGTAQHTAGWQLVLLQCQVLQPVCASSWVAPVCLQLQRPAPVKAQMARPAVAAAAATAGVRVRMRGKTQEQRVRGVWGTRAAACRRWQARQVGSTGRRGCSCLGGHCCLPPLLLAAMLLVRGSSSSSRCSQLGRKC